MHSPSASGSPQEIGGSSRDDNERPESQTVVFFGKTGDGKSTLCNMLLFSGLKEDFKTGKTIASVSQAVVTRSNVNDDDGCMWTVIDTIGLGDALETSESTSKVALSELNKFFDTNRTEVDHICFVMREGVFTVYESVYWKLFLDVFERYSQYIRLIFTSSSAGWLRKNKGDIENMMGIYPMIAVDFPPKSNDNDEEGRLSKVREKNLKLLQKFLTDEKKREPVTIGNKASPGHQDEGNKQPKTSRHVYGSKTAKPGNKSLRVHNK